jgi:hypothetical protein
MHRHQRYNESTYERDREEGRCVNHKIKVKENLHMYSGVLVTTNTGSRPAHFESLQKPSASFSYSWISSYFLGHYIFEQY